MATISGLLVGVEMKEAEPQQDTYQRILEKIGWVCHGHLFHNLPTISKGFSWCPITLLDMPLASSEATLSIRKNGEVVGTWKVFRLESFQEKYILKDTQHPLIEAKLHSSLKRKDDHRFLVEPEVESISRALLVKIMGGLSTKNCYQFVGSMYFHPPQEPDKNQPMEGEIVTILNTKGAEEIEAQACNEVKAGARVQKVTDNHEPNHPDIVEAEERVGPIAGQMVQRQTNSYPHDLNRRMETQAPVDKGKKGATCACKSEDDPNSQNLRLLSEAKNGKEEEVGRLISEGANVDFQDEYGRTPMSWAAEGGHEAVVKLLLEQYEVQYDSKDNGDQTPLSRAAEGGREAVVELLVKGFKSQYDSKDENGRTPLSRAAEGRHEAVVKLLLETGKVNIGSKDKDGRKPMSWAAEGGHKAVVKLLLERYEVQYDSKDNDDQTPLSRAAEGRHEAVVELLVRRFKIQYDSRDNGGRTPLSRATEGGHEAVVKLLLKWYEVDVDSKDNDGRTPLSRARGSGRAAA
jgi:ankyrin repeat protein